MKINIKYSDELVHNYDIETCQLQTTKHFKDTWMRKWDWDYRDLREAIRDAYKVEKMGKKKYEVYVRKKGEKKLIMAYYWDIDTLFIITGSEG